MKTLAKHRAILSVGSALTAIHNSRVASDCFGQLLGI